jgi:hypothetical protein
VWRVVSDAGLRGRLVAAGRRRLEDFAPERTRATFAAAIDRFVDLSAAHPGRAAT